MTPEPAPRAKDKKTPDVELFDWNAAKFKEFLSKLETYFRMLPESYPKKDFNGKMLYTSMRLMRGGGGNQDSPGLRVRGELWAATVELDLVGRDG